MTLFVFARRAYFTIRMRVSEIQQALQGIFRPIINQQQAGFQWHRWGFNDTRNPLTNQSLRTQPVLSKTPGSCGRPTWLK